MARQVTLDDAEALESADITVVLDASGSMESLRKDVVGGFNKMLEDQRKLPGKAYLTAVRFNAEPEVFLDARELSEVPPLTLDEYQTGGGTALRDAIGVALEAADERYPAKTPSRRVLVVITDGEENSSRNPDWPMERVKEEIEKRQADGWLVLYLGVGLDSFRDESAGHGVVAVASGNIGAENVQVGMEALSAGLHAYRSSKGPVLTAAIGARSAYASSLTHAGGESAESKPKP